MVVDVPSDAGACIHILLHVLLGHKIVGPSADGISRWVNINITGNADTSNLDALASVTKKTPPKRGLEIKIYAIRSQM